MAPELVGRTGVTGKVIVQFTNWSADTLANAPNTLRVNVPEILINTSVVADILNSYTYPAWVGNVKLDICKFPTYLTPLIVTRFEVVNTLVLILVND